MEVKLSSVKNMKILGTDSDNHQTFFDTAPEFGGENSAPTPMEIMLQAMGACSYMDIISILKKKRRQIDSLEMQLTGTRANSHPKVFTKVHIKYILKSPDTEIKDLERAIELSQTTYCGASAMFQRSGCEVTTEAVLN